MSNRQVEEDSGSIYYFLGNTTSHILHALPLWRKLGGTFIVLSDKAKKNIESQYDVPVLAIDNVPYLWRRFGWKLKPIHEYDCVTSRHKKTVDFLNQNSRVVLFYDLFNFDISVRLTQPKTIFLTHGNMLKNYMGENNRLQTFQQYDYMAALGPYLNKKFLRMGIPDQKLIPIGVARTDDVVKHQGEIAVSPEMTRELNIDPGKLIVSYMPTFWGASSIYTTGLQIIRNWPEKYTLLFRPHPATPQKILREYITLIDSKPNVYFIPEGKYKDISLIDIFTASSAIIGDISSVMLEAILTKKPLMFAYDTALHRQPDTNYDAIREVIQHSSIIDDSTSDIESVVDHTLTRGIDEDMWQSTVENNFYYADGTSVESIKEFVESEL